LPISKIISGGQTGVDRAALDSAAALSISYGGWCPKDGHAEDMTSPPGLIAIYPALKTTPDRAPRQRTEWNVRDSDAVLILVDSRGIACSPGTVFAQEQAQSHCKPALVVNIGDYTSLEHTMVWLDDFEADIVLNVAGPRESEAPGIYDAATYFLGELLEAIV
jgi:hypothetical protein